MTIRGGFILYVIEEATIPEEQKFGAYVALTALPVFGIRPVLAGGESAAAARLNIEEKAGALGVAIKEVTG